MANFFYKKANRVYLGSMLIPMLILSLLTSFYFYQNRRSAELEINRGVLNTAEINISTAIEQMNLCSLYWINNNDVYSFYKSVNANNGVIPEKPFKVAEEYIATCNRLLSLSGKNVVGIGFYPFNNPNQSYYYLQKYRGKMIQINQFPLDLSAQKGIGKLRSIQFCIPHEANYISTGEKKVFSIIRTINNIDSKKTIGYVKIDVFSDYLNGIFRGINTGKNSGYFIADHSGNIVYSLHDGNSHAEESWNEEVNSVFIPREGKYYYEFTNIEGTPWYIVFYLSGKDLFSQGIFIIIPTILLGICAIAVSLILYNTISHKMNTPINNILKTMEANSKGILHKRIEIAPEDNNEFTYISKQYNSMLDMLEEHIEKEYKAKLAQEKAEMTSLQMQINPHFLYNTLNTVIALNRSRETQLLEKTVLRLTELFRYTCSNIHTASISEELDFVRRYLFIQSLRFNEKMEYSIMCDEEAKDISIPKLLIQPLVENSVLHAVESSEKKVAIRICVSISNNEIDKTIHISVQDNGCGVDIEKLWEKAEEHVGIKNVQLRVKTLLPNGQFFVRSEPGKGFESVIQFSA